MDYVGPVHGSPLIHPVILYGYAAFVLLSLFIIFRIPRLRRVFIILHINSFLLLASIATTILIPAPRALKIEHEQSKITIVFDRPVKRKTLQKSIAPPLPGTWAFEDPIYATHLYRSLVFYPHAPLQPGTTHTVMISEIANFLQFLSPPLSLTKQLHTKIELVDTSVLGIQHDTSEKTIAVLGIFPGDSWTGVGVDQPIRIQFNQEVNKESAESHIAISPVTHGTFGWDGKTLEFRPVNEWLFNNKYTVYISPGIRGLSGTESTYGYSMAFTTQEKITRLAVPTYLQEYALSCEAAALRMALAYRGVSVSEDELLTKLGTDPTNKNGSVWGNPYVGFVGNVRGKQMTRGYGVYWEPITRVARSYRHAESFTGGNISKLTEMVQRQHPVIIWGYVKNGLLCGIPQEATELLESQTNIRC